MDEEIKRIPADEAAEPPAEQSTEEKPRLPVLTFREALRLAYTIFR